MRHHHAQPARPTPARRDGAGEGRRADRGDGRRGGRHHHRRDRQRLGLWLLMLALVVYGYAGTLAQLLGPAHHHHPAGNGPAAQARSLTRPPPVATEAVLERLQAWRAASQAAYALPGWAASGTDPADAASPARAHPHAHDQWARHHHAAADSSVVTLPGTDTVAHDAALADGASGATAGSSSQPMGLASGLGLWAAAGREHLRAPRQAPIWADALPRRLERPPQA